MNVVSLERPDDFSGFRAAAREHLAAGTHPEDIVWQQPDAHDLFAQEAYAPAESEVGSVTKTATVSTQKARYRIPAVSRHFVDLAERAVCHRTPDRFARLYRVLWRFVVGKEERLLEQSADPDMHYLHILGKSVARERHKMHAFLRFRETPGMNVEHFHAWFEPEHHSLRLSTPFFVRRFANMHWSIVTPAESAHWDGNTLQFGPGGHRCEGPAQDAFEPLWRTYFASIFNPARLMEDAMLSEMPVKYWKNLPEAELIHELVQSAGSRTDAMLEASKEPARQPRSNQGRALARR
jgi:DNA polymerase